MQHALRQERGGGERGREGKREKKGEGGEREGGGERGREGEERGKIGGKEGKRWEER